MDYKSTILILPWSPVTVLQNQPSYGGPTLRPWARAASTARAAWSGQFQAPWRVKTHHSGRRRKEGRLGQNWVGVLGYTLWLWLLHSHGFSMAHRFIDDLPSERNLHSHGIDDIHTSPWVFRWRSSIYRCFTMGLPFFFSHGSFQFAMFVTSLGFDVFLGVPMGGSMGSFLRPVLDWDTVPNGVTEMPKKDFGYSTW